MLKKLAQLVSLLLHPLWIPTYLFALVFTFTPTLATPINRESMPLFLVLVFLLTGLIPLLSVVVLRLPYFLLLNKVWRRSRTQNWSSRRSLYSLRSQVEKVRKNSVVHSFAMSHRWERVVPFFMITVFYVAVCVMLSGRLGWGSFFIVAMMTVAFTSLVVSLITLMWKISVHSVAISSLIGFLLAVMLARAESILLVPLSLSIIAGGVLMSSRLYLNQHTPLQVGLGCLTGFLISFTISYWYF